MRVLCKRNLRDLKGCDTSVGMRTVSRPTFFSQRYLGDLIEGGYLHKPGMD